MFLLMHLLERVGLKERYEDAIWNYLGTVITQTVSEFQVDHKISDTLDFTPTTQYSPEELGNLLTKAVEGLTPTQVTMFHLLVRIHALLVFDIQILRFLRIDRKATATGDSTAQKCISFHVKTLCDALEDKGELLKPSEFLGKLQNLPLNTTNPQWFLNDTSDLIHIPSSRSLLKIHGQQRKCCHIYHSVFSEDVLAKLSSGFATNLSL